VNLKNKIKKSLMIDDELKNPLLYKNSITSPRKFDYSNAFDNPIREGGILL
jgi:hypothetical protein